MKIAVISGTRRATRKGAAWAWLCEVNPDAVIVGGATGIDTETRGWARERGKFVIEVPAPWRPAEPRADGLDYDPEAGMRRNAFMIEVVAVALRAQGHELLGGAFPDKQSVGTHDAIRRLRAVGIPTVLP